MSEYQYLEFAAVDRPLSSDEMAFMRKQSTRAEITRTSFVNEYEFGDFHGDAPAMLRRGFDVHLHYANFGIRKLMFHLPGGLPVGGDAYLRGEYLEWDADSAGPGGILTVSPEGDAGTYEEDFWQQLTADWGVRIRASLIGGDLRSFFLMWLATWPVDESVPVPAGMDELPAWADILCEFYEIDPKLIAAAADRSESLSEKTSEATANIQQRLSKLKKNELLTLLQTIVENDDVVKRRVEAALVGEDTSVAPWPVTDDVYSWIELGGAFD